jgi:magnesium-transporting ATPase (P-type)
MSQIEIKVNYILGFIILLQIILCLICGIVYGNLRNNNQQPNKINDYISWPDYSLAVDGFLVFLTYIALLNTMIPISLIVSM